MQADRSNSGTDTMLFRQAAVKAAGFRLFGDACVTLPPSANVCVLVGVVATALLVFVLWVVEVPSRIMATGMLMPRGGPLDVVAPQSGQVSVVYIREEQLVKEGDVLLEIVPNGKNTNGNLGSLAELQSLRDEYDLLDVILERQRAVFLERQNRLSGEVEAAQRLIEFGRQRATTVAGKIAVLEARVNRMKLLSQAGHVAHDTMEREELALLEVGITAREIEAQLSATRAELAGLGSRGNEIQRELELAVAEHSVRRQSLMREIERREYQSVHTVISPRSGTIARVATYTGMPVRKGQLLARIFADSDVAEAWLYVASANARRIVRGETVELQLDAWPAAEFGTVTATVDTVSSFVLGPAEIPIPVAVTGPVFEVRASISERELAGKVPGPGTTFKAQIISRRYRLYQWLTKRLRDSANSDRA